jgi:hypothetical protein
MLRHGGIKVLICKQKIPATCLMACVASGRNDLMAARRLNEIRISTPFGHIIAAKGPIELRRRAHELVRLLIQCGWCFPKVAGGLLMRNSERRI